MQYSLHFCKCLCFILWIIYFPLAVYVYECVSVLSVFLLHCCQSVSIGVVLVSRLLCCFWSTIRDRLMLHWWHTHTHTHTHTALCVSACVCHAFICIPVCGLCVLLLVGTAQFSSLLLGQWLIQTPMTHPSTTTNTFYTFTAITPNHHLFSFTVQFK